MANATNSMKSMKKNEYFALTFGTIIGVGWITVLGFWLSNAGPVGASLAFLIGILMFIPVGLCYAEMCAIYPHTGGPIIYSLHEFGIFSSFITGWMLCLTFFFVIIFEIISIGWLLETIFPPLKGPALYEFNGSVIHLGHVVFGIGVNLILSYLNYKGSQSSGKTQSFMTYGLVCVVLILVVAALLNGSLENLEPHFVESASGSIWPGFLAVLLTVPFYLTGFEAIAQGVSERDRSVSEKSIAKIIMLAICGGAIFYIAIIMSAAAVAPRTDLIEANLAAAKAFEIGLSSSLLAKIVLMGGFLGLLSTWNASIFIFIRALLALGKAKMVWSGFAETNSAGISKYAILFVVFAGSLGALLGKNTIFPIINASSTAIGFLFLIVCGSVISSRLHNPELKRAYRVPGGIILPVLGCLTSLFVIYLTFMDPYVPGEGIPLEWYLFGGFLLLGLVFWMIGSSSRKGLTIDQIKEKVTQET